MIFGLQDAIRWAFTLILLAFVWMKYEVALLFCVTLSAISIEIIAIIIRYILREINELKERIKPQRHGTR